MYSRELDGFRDPRPPYEISFSTAEGEKEEAAVVDNYTVIPTGTFKKTSLAPAYRLPRVSREITRSGNYNLSTSTASIGKVLQSEELGKGAFGSVKIILTNRDGILKEEAVKIIEYHGIGHVDNKLKNFHDFVLSNQLDHVLLVPFAMLYEPQAATAYQIMPLGQFGDGNRLITALAQLNSEEKALIKRHVMLSLIHAGVLMSQYKIMHLDIKPANIVFDDKGKCYLCDFDLSVILRSDGEYIHKPNQLGWDVAFAPYNQPSANSINAANREVMFSALDAYRLGLTCLLIYCEISKEEAEKINLRELKQEQLQSMFDKTDVPHEIRAIITALLSYDLQNRMTVVGAARAVQGWELDELQKSQVQCIFADWCAKRKVDRSEVVVPSCNMQSLISTLEQPHAEQRVDQIMRLSVSGVRSKCNDDNFQEESEQEAYAVDSLSKKRKAGKVKVKGKTPALKKSKQLELNGCTQQFFNQPTTFVDKTKQRPVNPLKVTRK